MLDRVGAIRRTGTVSLKVKLLQKFMAIREKVIYKVFLDLRKAYDTLDWEHCMETMVGYSTRPRMNRYIHIYWDHFLMIDWSVKYYGGPFQGLCGATQGDPLSPTILNIMVDAVTWH